ncbi:MAG: hypothetical protein ABIH46_04775, partial [Chloroflexota bacterium]
MSEVQGDYGVTVEIEPADLGRVSGFVVKDVVVSKEIEAEQGEGLTIIGNPEIAGILVLADR